MRMSLTPSPRVLVLACALILAAPAAASPPEFVGVPSVIDGDTLEVRGTRIRLHGVDAPESSQTCVRDARAFPCGRAVANLLSDKINRGLVRCVQRDIDRYQRVVAECFLGDESLNQWLVASGMAMAYRQYSKQYAGDEDLARVRGVGLWAMTFEPPWDFRKARRDGGR